MRIQSVDVRTASDSHHNSNYVTITTESGLVGLGEAYALVPIGRLLKPCATWANSPEARNRCATEEPELTDVGGGHFVSCHFWQDIEAKGGALPMAANGASGG